MLFDRNIIDPADWTTALEQAARDVDVQVIDDTDSQPRDDAESLPTADLLALRRAVDDVSG